MQMDSSGLYYMIVVLMLFHKMQSEWKKQRSCHHQELLDITHTLLFLQHHFLKMQILNVDDGATKAKIKSAFIKSLKTKKLNKKVLGEFISLVA